MRYEMRTKFTLEPDDPTTAEGAGRADRVLRWLHEYLPTVADMGIGPAHGKWVGDRYNQLDVSFQLLTEYADVYGATADRLRIGQALQGRPPRAVSNLSPAVTFELFQLYDDQELGDPGVATKTITNPRKIAHPG